MPNGSVNITLRPIKLALLVNPKDKSAILEAIQINTFLWGGIYNPIVPVYKKKPSNWDRHSSLTSYKKIIEGYINTFDPDYIVKIGDLEDINYLTEKRKIISPGDIYSNEKNKLLPKYGLSIHEVMNQFIDDELKFIRKYPLTLTTFSYSDSYNLFLKSVFGDLSDNINKQFMDYYKDYYPFEIKDCKIDAFGDYFNYKYQFLRRISEKYIRHVRTRDAWRSDCVFILDAKNNLDIIDYWNLRAIGWSILPFPIQSIKDDKLIKHISCFIDNNFYPTQNNPDIYNETTILKGRSVKLEVYKDMVDSLNLKSSENSKRGKYSAQTWYPRMWDEWAREYDNVEYCIIESESKSIELPSNDENVVFDNLKPSFANYYWREGSQFANEIEFHIYSDEKELLAKVIPEGSRRLIHAFKTYGFEEWRFSRIGMIYLSKHNEEKIKFSLPKAQDIFFKWLEDKNYKPKLSENGYIVNQLIKYTGGTWDLMHIAYEPIIKLLRELRDGRRKSVNQIMQLLSGLYDNDKKNVKRQYLIETLCKLKIIRSGFEIRCPVCMETSWFSLKDLNYKLSCPRCLSDSEVLIATEKDIHLSFKSLGPFSFSNENYGVLSELLTLRFFTNVMRNPVTIVPGFKLSEDIEIDLGVLMQSSYMGDKKIKLLFAECKSHNEFINKDIRRMKLVATNFPGSILVFATLRKKLSKKEIKLLSPLIKMEQKNRITNKPYNSVLILTGIELFSQDHEPPYCWRDLGGKYEEYISGKKHFHDLDGLCKATQDIYLNINPVPETIKGVFENGQTGKFVL